MYLIVGLGNPGAEYENTRHNLGFKVIDELAARFQLTAFKKKLNSEIAEIKINNHKVILAKPQTFMNNSGVAVRALMSWYKFKPENLIVIYDDVDLEVGQLRVRDKGNAGGHHGIESVIQHLGTTQFGRVRIGIGREGYGDVADYVLQAIPHSQSEILAEAVTKAAEAVESSILHGLVRTMNSFNS
ncbi:MAG: aminoacyl-tRNA hydrolase [bacterium]